MSPCSGTSAEHHHMSVDHIGRDHMSPCSGRSAQHHMSVDHIACPCHTWRHHMTPWSCRSAQHKYERKHLFVLFILLILHTSINDTWQCCCKPAAACRDMYSIRQHTYSILQHTSAYVSIRCYNLPQHIELCTAYVSIRQHTLLQPAAAYKAL